MRPSFDFDDDVSMTPPSSIITQNQNQNHDSAHVASINDASWLATLHRTAGSSRHYAAPFPNTTTPTTMTTATTAKAVVGDRFIPSRKHSTLSYEHLDASFPNGHVPVPTVVSDAHLLTTNGSLYATAAGEREDSTAAYNHMLRAELLGMDAGPYHASGSLLPSDKGMPISSTHTTTAAERDGIAGRTPLSPVKNVLRFSASADDATNLSDSPFSLSAVGGARDGDPRHLLNSFQERQQAGFAGAQPRRTPRKIARTPFKVLDAPALQDDFYLNLVDWSAHNVLAVGLGTCVYLWSACTSKVTKLLDLGRPDNKVCSVSWTGRGTYLAVGTEKGEVEVWDAREQKKVRVLSGHKQRAGCLSWSGSSLSSGSRDRSILHRDVRQSNDYCAKLVGHKSEVCGLKWSPDGRELASGGNDNAICVWSAAQLVSNGGGAVVGGGSSMPTSPSQARGSQRTSSAGGGGGGGGSPMSIAAAGGGSWSPLVGGGDDAAAATTTAAAAATTTPTWTPPASPSRIAWATPPRGEAAGVVEPAALHRPMLRYTAHSAAVKALAWSPHQHGLLASGGGTADRTIRFWSTATQAAIGAFDTGSQVCNLAWSRTSNELVSTHGYSQNQIIVWRLPGMTKLATLTGHTLRVLYLAVSPDGQTICTGAGDETLRFWGVFPPPRSGGNSRGSPWPSVR